MPGDILCMVLGQNEDSDRQNWDKQTALGILGAIVFIFFFEDTTAYQAEKSTYSR